MLYSLFLVLLSVGIYTTYGCDPYSIPDDCTVSENPKTTVVKTNDTAVNISCSIKIQFDKIFLLFNEESSSESLKDAFLEKHKISFDCSSMACSVLIPAIKENDDLQVQCVFADCCTEIAVIHVVDGIPDPPDLPSVQSINSTSLNVTWSSPWKEPVNYYVLSIVTNNDDTRNISVNGNSYIVNRPDNFDCATYSFSVSASTDIGDTDFSKVSFGNFSTDLKGAANFMNESFTEIFEKYECGSTSTYKVTVEALDMCPHETFEYQFEVFSVESATRDPVIVTPNSDSPIFFFVVDDTGQSEYNVTAFIFNEFGESLNIYETIDLSKSGLVMDYPPITKLTTTVALIDTDANFTCSKGAIDGSSLFVIVNNTIVSDSNGDGVVTTTLDGNYTITIPARIENNNTGIRCFISPCFSEEAILIVVNSLPDAVKRPSVIKMNNTSILISWSPPWPHPINGYQLTVINSTSGRNQQVEYSVRDDSFVLNNPSGFECNDLSVVVQANTDLGITALENFKNISFFKGLMNLDTIISSKQYHFIEGTAVEPPTLAVDFLPPPVCEQESLSYKFMLTNLILNEVLTQQSSNSSTEFKLSNNFLRDDELKLAVAVIVLDGLANATVQLFDSINITVSSPPTSSTQSQVVIVSTVGAASFLLILFAVAIASFVCFYWYRRSIKHRRVRSDGTRSVDVINFQLPPMIVNTQYATADEVLYESINECGTYSTIQDHIGVPDLPPPRTISDKLSDPSLDVQDKVTDKKVDDEYVKMSRADGKIAAVEEGSPRYVPGPMMCRDDDEETNIEQTVFDYGNTNGQTTVL